MRQWFMGTPLAFPTAHGTGRSVFRTAPAHRHVFNDDLLLHDGDVVYAAEQFPRIVHLLDHPELRTVFAKYDAEANAARSRVRSLGFASVLFGTLALLTISTRPLWESITYAKWVALALELAGFVAGLIAAGGFWLGPWKRRWLESRMMAERLRQWHFQLFVRRGGELERSTSSPAAMKGFLATRDHWFDEFLQGHAGHLDAKLEALTSELSGAETWLHPRLPSYAPDGDVITEVFRAYKQLRLDHQYGFAVYKLRRTDDKSLWQFLAWPPIRQAALLSALASVAFTGALFSSGFLVYGYALGIPVAIERIVRATAISAAVIGLALRTLREGLAPEQEIERYNDYRGRTAQLRARFIETRDAKERLHLMEELERASADELRGFLRTHQRATFLLT